MKPSDSVGKNSDMHGNAFVDRRSRTVIEQRQRNDDVELKIVSGHASRHPRMGHDQLGQLQQFRRGPPCL